MHIDSPRYPALFGRQTKAELRLNRLRCLATWQLHKGPSAHAYIHKSHNRKWEEVCCINLRRRLGGFPSNARLTKPRTIAESQEALPHFLQCPAQKSSIRTRCPLVLFRWHFCKLHRLLLQTNRNSNRAREPYPSFVPSARGYNWVSEACDFYHPFVES